MSSSVCYFYFSPVIDKTQPICHAVIPLRFLILIFLFKSTVMTKENLHLKKKKSKLTTVSMWNENENLSLMNFLIAQWLGYEFKTSLPGKKRLLIRTVFVLIGRKTERSTWSFIAQKARVSLVAYLHVSAAFIKKEKSLGWSKTSKRKWTFEFVESIKHTQMKGKQCNLLKQLSYDLEMKTREQNKQQTSGNSDLIGTSARGVWLVSEHSGEKTSFPRTC